MRRKDWARILDPSQHIYSKSQPDPFTARRPHVERRLTASPALRAEIRRRLLAGQMLNRKELEQNFCVGHHTVQMATEYESGRISGEREILLLWLMNRDRVLAHQRHLSKEERRPQNMIWQRYMRELLVEIARTTPTFTTDLLDATRKERGGPEGEYGYGYGNLIRWAKRQRIAEPTETLVMATRLTSPHKIRIWRSLICEEAVEPNGHSPRYAHEQLPDPPSSDQSSIQPSAELSANHSEL